MVFDVARKFLTRTKSMYDGMKIKMPCSRVLSDRDLRVSVGMIASVKYLNLSSDWFGMLVVANRENVCFGWIGKSSIVP